MKALSLELIPKVHVQFTKWEVDVIEACADHHYDGMVRNQVGVKLVYAMRQQLRVQEHFPTSTTTLSMDDIDITLKALEQTGILENTVGARKAKLAMPLRAKLRELLRYASSKYVREVNPLREGPKPKRRPRSLSLFP